MKQITCKLGNMRKAVQWVVYPANGGDTMLIQSDHRICRFNPETGEGVLGGHAPNYSCNVDLIRRGATKVVVPPDVIAAAKAAQPHSGDHIGGGVYVA